MKICENYVAFKSFYPKPSVPTTCYFRIISRNVFLHLSDPSHQIPMKFIINNLINNDRFKLNAI